MARQEMKSGIARQRVTPVGILLFAFSLLALSLFALIVGCGDGLPRRYPVRGLVQFPDGEPVKTGIVEFTSADGQHSATGYIDRQGEFSLTTLKNSDGAVAGKHAVIIKQFIKIDNNSDVVHDHGGLVDEQYADYDNKLIEVEVLPQKNRFTITVKEKL